VAAKGTDLPSVVAASLTVEVQHGLRVLRAFLIRAPKDVPTSTVWTAKFVARLQSSLAHLLESLATGSDSLGLGNRCEPKC
jgi:hypothetical protein